MRKSVGLAGSLNNFEATIKPDNPNPDANPKPTIKPDNANAHLYLCPLSSLLFLFLVVDSTILGAVVDKGQEENEPRLPKDHETQHSDQ